MVLSALCRLHLGHAGVSRGRFEIKRLEETLARLAGRAHEIAQNGNVGSIRADAPGIHGQTKPLGEIKVHARIVQLGQAESLRRQHPVYARRIHRPWRTVALPGAARQFIKLLPIAFVPSRHFNRNCKPVHIYYYVPLTRLDAPQVQKVPGGSHSFSTCRACFKTALRPPNRVPHGANHTAQYVRQGIFLAWCFKHVTGRFVSRR